MTTTNDDSGITSTLTTLVALANGGTGADLSATGGAGQVVKQTSVGGALTVGALTAADLSGTTVQFNAALTDDDFATKGAAQTFALKQTFTTAPELTAGFTERGRSAKAGEWTAYTPTFTANSGTFTPTIVTARYALVGKTLLISIRLAPCTVSVGAVWLGVSLPPGITAATLTNIALTYNDNGARGNGTVEVQPGGTAFYMYKDFDASAAWTASAGNSKFAFSAGSIEVQ